MAVTVAANGEVVRTLVDTPAVLGAMPAGVVRAPGGHTFLRVEELHATLKWLGRHDGEHTERTLES